MVRRISIVTALSQLRLCEHRAVLVVITPHNIVVIRHYFEWRFVIVGHIFTYVYDGPSLWMPWFMKGTITI